MLPNRVALYFLLFAGAGGAAIPALANFDTSSVIGWAAGLVAISTGIGTFLFNWGKYEERADLERLGVPDYDPALDKPADFKEPPEAA